MSFIIVLGQFICNRTVFLRCVHQLCRGDKNRHTEASSVEQIREARNRPTPVESIFCVWEGSHSHGGGGEKTLHTGTQGLEAFSCPFPPCSSGPPCSRLPARPHSLTSTSPSISCRSYLSPRLRQSGPVEGRRWCRVLVLHRSPLICE